jgi:hypothetical protein
MQDNGYKTGHFGKWHLGSAPGVGTPSPIAYGIDESCTFNSIDTCKADGHTANSSTNIVDSAIDFITRKAGSPFYVNVQCAFFDRTLHSRMSLVTAPCSELECNQLLCSRASTFLPVHTVNSVQTLKVWLHVSHNLLNPSAEQKAACVANSAQCACTGLSDNQTTCVQSLQLLRVPSCSRQLLDRMYAGLKALFEIQNQISICFCLLSCLQWVGLVEVHMRVTHTLTLSLSIKL